VTSSSRRRARRRAAGALVGLAGAALAGAVSRRYRRDIGEARRRIATGSRIADTPGGPVEYAAAGDGPPLLVIHGAGGGFDQAMLLAEPLVRSGFRVIAMSRFGYLRTPVPNDASAAAQADAHARLLDALGVPRAAVLGASAGAPSAMQLAIRHPERTAALVLLVPAAYPFQIRRTPEGGAPKRTSRETALLFDTALRSDFLFWLACRIARRTVSRGILATPPAVLERASAAERARADAVVSYILPVSRRRLGLRNDAAVVSSLPRYDLERIAAPTLVLSAADDLFRTWDGARYTADHVPNARFVGYPSGGHLWIGHHEEVMAEAAGFLRGALA